MTHYRLEDFPLIISEKVRFSDTDIQGHVNHLNFHMFLEAGRVEGLHGTQWDLRIPGAFFVLARTCVDLLGELLWPGHVDVGNRVQRIGSSSLQFHQVLFQNGRCAAFAESTMVQVDSASRKAIPLSDAARKQLTLLM